MSRRHHDSAVRILYNAHTPQFYLRDLGGRVVASQHVTGLALESVEELLTLAHRRYPGEVVLITATVLSLALSNTLDLYVMRQAKMTRTMDYGDNTRDWVTAMHSKLHESFKMLGYLTADEFEAVRAIIDAGEIEAVPVYLASLAALKTG